MPASCFVFPSQSAVVKSSDAEVNLWSGFESHMAGGGGDRLEGILLGSNFESPAEGENQMYLLVGMCCHCRMPGIGQLYLGTYFSKFNFKVKSLVVSDLLPGERLHLPTAEVEEDKHAIPGIFS